MELPPSSREMHAPRQLRQGGDTEQNMNSRRKTRNTGKPRREGKQKAQASKPLTPNPKPALPRRSRRYGRALVARDASAVGYITPDRSPNKKQYTRWTGMFRAGTPDPVPDLDIPPLNPAFENPDVKSPVKPSTNVLAEDYKHMVCNPKWGTPKPWRQGLERMFDGLASESIKRAYLKYYTIGYTEAPLKAAAPSDLLEQAFLFGVMERQWDLEVESSLYRFYHGISESGALKGVPHYYYGTLD
ncbi:hypothetical protein TWF481_010692 [Arthrobotrys musiformis]|uniref:Uncharacterized protein n=1 Tax=Arthrobotrys musiformis TaxID=47236 RepID=A0AAV9W3W4_9PEZI